MVAVRRLAAAGGHPLPKRIPPAEHNLKGILGAAGPREPETPGRPWLIAAVVGSTLLLGALLVVVHRRTGASPSPILSPARGPQSLKLGAPNARVQDGGRGHSPRASSPNRSWSMACTSASA